MRKSLVQTILVLGLPGLADVAMANATVIDVPLPSGCTLAVDVVRDETPACWRLACPGKPVRELACDVTAMHQVVSVTLGEADTTLAVMSVGEGHPILELVPLAPLVDAGIYDAACTINPYPGTFGAVSPVSDGWLLQTSIDLIENQPQPRVASIEGGPWWFRVSATQCLPARIGSELTRSE